MGALVSCCFDGNSSGSELLPQPDAETKRMQQAEAAEKRLKEMESRGIKNPSKLQEKQKRLEQMEAREDEALRQGNTGSGLKWTVG